MREIEIIAASTSTKYVLFGFDANTTGSFMVQMYIEKHGKRAVEFLQSISLGFVSFMGGNLYIHNSDEVDRCNMFGEQKDCKLGVIFNEEAGTKKVLDSIALHTDDDEWEVESITIPPDKNYPHGQYSKIPSTKFIKREGCLYSEFMRNMKTTSSTAKAIEAITGEELRANAAYLILKNTAKTKVQIWEVQINATKSR